DIGIALVELLAYVGDHLSYQQDVIATEAYLDRARRRTSVRRHAVLVDYPMHDGCNARAWMQLQTDSDGVTVHRGTPLLTRVAGVGEVVDLAVDGVAKRRIAEAVPETFETVEEATLFKAHNEIELYTFLEERCCLPAGSTGATLKGAFPHLSIGDVLVFEERVGPETGEAADADPTHRHAVRLTSVGSLRDPLIVLDDGTTPQPLTEIQWHGDDALPFALCISARTKKGYQPKVSVVLGNIVLADHGQTISSESLGVVPD